MKQNRNAAGLADQQNFGCGNPEYYLELFIDDFIILERYCFVSLILKLNKCSIKANSIHKTSNSFSEQVHFGNFK